MPSRSFVFLFSLVLIGGLTVAQQAPRQRAANPRTATAGEALAGLTAAQMTKFVNGRAEFLEDEEVGDGLGPLFNGRSCGECHGVPAIGGGDATRFVTRFGRTINGAFDPLADFGGTLIQDHALGIADGSPHAFAAETVPAQATIVAHRRATPLFGLGLVDATPDADFIALAAREAARGDGTGGRVAMVDNFSAGMKTVGKFGWKAQNPTIFQFAGDAYVNEMGITSAQFPSENCPNGNCSELAFNPSPGINDGGSGVQSLADFMTLLAPPPRASSRDADAGEALFERIGCTACHVATLRSGSSSIAALDHQTYHPYSDFLLHDMGSLGDGIEQNNARGRDFRTAPLWGLRYVTAYLHDGRASTLDAAILAHDGQARASRDRFAALDRDSKGKVRAFLGSL
jgi:CxxC motif-containing protein (DUF1111 family)